MSLENPMDGAAWWAAVHGVAKSRTRLSDFTLFSLSCIGEGNGNPLQCSCLGNPRDGGAWWAAVYGVTQSQTPLKWLSSGSSSYDEQESWPETAGRDEEPLVVSVAFLAAGVQWSLRFQVKRDAGLEMRPGLCPSSATNQLDGFALSCSILKGLHCKFSFCS